MTSHTFQIDPHAILGVTSSSSLQEIRDAYRSKSKKYHPDVGGEEWAFRILYQAYEILSQARVASRAAESSHTPPNHGPSTHSPSGHATPPPRQPFTSSATVRGGGNSSASGETVRRGVRDQAASALSLVDVEILWIRFEAEHVWLFQVGSASQDDRSLSCCVNISWPDATIIESGIPLPANHEHTIALLKHQVESVAAKSKAHSWRTHNEDGRFTGLLSYPSADPAWTAFRLFKDALHSAGFGVNQWSRDIVIPREWR